jgi:type VI secretion system secreted protein Hcp
MAVDIFIKIDDIKGESIDDTYKDNIECTSWSWGMNQSGTSHFGPGTGTGKVSVRDLSFTKYVDRATPILMKYCCKGKFFDLGTLVVRKAGDKPLEYVKLELMDGLISSVTHGGTGQDERLIETVTLNFKAFKMHYKPQKDGKGEGAVPAGWNIAKNIEL